MPEFLVETYPLGFDAAQRDEVARRARQAAAALSHDGDRVRLVRSFLVPEDDSCFYLFEGPSAEAVREVVVRADLDFDRIVEAR